MTERLERLAAAWTVLARLIAAPPTPEALDEVRSAELLADWPLPAGPRTDAGLALLAASAAAGEGAATVADDHFRLFRGPGRVAAPPWESVYRSTERLLFEESTFEVRAAYARFDLRAPNPNREPDDHIALELEFCATLLSRAVEALASGDAANAAELVAAHDAFCTEHLLVFGPEFFGVVEAAAGTLFYRGIGVLGADALAQVADRLP